MAFKNVSFNFKNLFQFNSRLCKISRKISSVNSLSLGDLGINFEKLNDPKVVEEVEKNIRQRKGVGNIRRVLELKQEFDKELNLENKEKLHSILVAEAKQLPNTSHPDVENYKEHPHVLHQAKRFRPPFPIKEFSKLAKDLKILRTEALNSLTGTKSYYLLGALADLEHALVRYVLSNLIKNKFQLISVPDILPAEVIESCGMTVKGDRSQVYILDERHGKNICLSGTSEMALAGLFANRTLEEKELPLRLCAVSRCYRSEVSNVAEERGIYRVHQFTKVEMFAVCAPNQSDEMLAEFLALEEAQFEALELNFQSLDMPRHELGAPAYRKHDIEAWFPARAIFGELSSCSNCTDYQARRLQARMRTATGENAFVHTVNGTACAVPRTIMALIETLQQADGTIRVPAPLVPFMQRDVICPADYALQVKVKARH